MTDCEIRETTRARLLAAIPESYSPWLHLASTVGSGLVVLAVAVAMIRHPAARDWVVVPVTFVLANWLEWRAHRSILHRRWKPMRVLYDQHTPNHHMVYQYEDMAIRSWRELKLVLIPGFGVLAIVVAAAPVAFVAGLASSANAAWLVLVTSALYVVLYELSHLAYHLRPESFVGRLALVRVLREHHARHHDPRLMQRWNFNVTVPLFDWIHGTIARREQLTQAPQQDAAPSPTS